MRLLFLFCLVLILFSSTLITTENGGGLIYLVYILFILLIPMVVFLLKKKKFYVNKVTISLLIGYLFFSSFSALVNNDPSLIFTSLLLLLLYLSICVMMPSLFQKYDELILKLSAFSLGCLIFLPVLINGIDSTPYRGIFYNTNSFGITTTTLFTVFAVLLFGEIEKYLANKNSKRKQLIRIFIYIITLFICFILVTSSGSRTSVLTCSFILIFGILMLIFSIIKYRRLKSIGIQVPLVTLLVLIIGLIILKTTNLSYYLENNILSKFSRTTQQGDVFNGRSQSWEIILNETGLFRQSIDQLLIAPHNTFFAVLSTNGWIPFIFFVLFFITSLFYSFKYFFKTNSPNKYFPVLSIMSFAFMSMTEIMLYKPSMIVAFAAIGIATNNKIIKVSL